MAKKKTESHIQYPESLSELSEQKQQLEELELHLIDKALRSDNPKAYIEAKSYIKNIEDKKNNNLRSFTFSPMLDYYSGQGYKIKPQGLNNDLLRNMANTPQIKAIINTRIEQASNFNQFTINDQVPGWTIKKRKGLFDEEEKELTDKEKREIEQIVLFLERGGNVSKWDFDGWETFTRKLFEDSWALDQGIFEVAVDRMGRPSVFDAFDGTTFFLAEHNIRTEADLKRLEPYMINGYLPRYTQVFGNSVHREYYPWELCFGIRNASTSVKLNGYGLSENEVLIQVITWMLNSNSYNGNFFCISEDSRIVTDLGIRDIKNLVDRDSFKVYDGVEWSNAKAYKTRVDDLYETRLYNGLKLKTSKEHRFLVFKEGETEPIWVEQKNIKEDDFCMVEINSHYNFNPDDYFVGKEYYREFTNPTKEAILRKPNTFTPTMEMIKDEEFWEMIGFAIGDGNWQDHVLQIFPHWEKDKEIFGKFFNVCERYGIRYKNRTINKKVTRGDGVKGYPAIFINHTTFIDWLIDLGLGYSRDKKIPLSVFNLPDNLKGAFLRGWFSADGHSERNVAGYKTPTLCCVDDNLRQDAIQLLLSLGVAAKEAGRGYKNYKGRNIIIFIQDVIGFINKVGYIQDYKNEGIFRHKRTQYKWDLLPSSLALNILCKYENCRISELTKVKNYIKNGGKISKGRLIRLLNEANVEVPSILNYHFIKIENVGRESIGVDQLYDVEVFNDKHIFLSNFVAVHNSQGSNPKGILNFKDNIDPTKLEEFKQAWSNTLSGVNKSHKLAAMSGGNLEWVNMQLNNRDMEFHKWSEFLTVLSCTVFRIDPDEVGFHLEGSKGMFGQDGQKERIKHSKEKGLEPFMKFWQRKFTKYLVEPLTQGKYEFVFTGLEVEDEEAQLKRDVDILQNGGMSVQDFFLKYNDRELDMNKDILLNQIMLQYKQMEQVGDPESNQAVDQDAGAFDEFEQKNGEEKDPFAKSLDHYMNKLVKENHK